MYYATIKALQAFVRAVVFLTNLCGVISENARMLPVAEIFFFFHSVLRPFQDYFAEIQLIP